MFKFKTFEEMTPADYEAVGLRVGLEIHQQLLTDKKLFCRCPAGHYSPEYDSEILRHMRPTLSELGEYDGTALMEFKTKKEIIYRIKRETVCTYEMDDTPPFMINEHALDIALEIAMLLNLKLVDELHVARKQYLDGSIPTGFQRTTIVGVDGWIPFKGRKIGLFQLGLEEDACREVSDIGHERIYLTDRLGMPLIEPVTAPDMRTPQEAAEVGDVLRRLMRSTGKVRTGHGATRQDVNVSVRGGTRIEIKGVHSLKIVPLLIYNEAKRQWNLLRIRELLAERGVTPETFEAGVFDVTGILSRTTYPPLRGVLGANGVARCVCLRDFKDILNEETQTDTVLSREIFDRIRVIACLNELPSVAHSDDVESMLSSAEWRKVRETTGAGDNDALIIAWGSEDDADCAAREIEIRAREMTEGIPSETRQALDDGTNGFERILPGADRMYPDTDLPPLALTKQHVKNIREELKEPVWDTGARLTQLGLSPDVIEKLEISPRLGLFDRLTGKMEITPALAGDVLARRLTWFRHRGLDTTKLSDDTIAEVLVEHRDGLFSSEGITPVLEKLLDGAGDAEQDDNRKRIRKVLKELGYEPVTGDALVREVKRTINEFDATVMRNPEKTVDHLMGILMKKLTGCAEGREVARCLDNLLSKENGA